MGSYKHILLAVDFFDQNQSVADKAKDLAEKYQARLSIIHVSIRCLLPIRLMRC